jgi:acetylornithine deacetylase
METAAIHDAVRRLLPETERFLCDIIRFPSTSGREQEVMQRLEGAFGRPGLTVEKVPLHDSLLSDPDYSDPIPGLAYEGRFNLRVTRPGRRAGRRLLFNAHADVVPPSEGMDAPFAPRVENGVVFGRGACDAKGQIALVYLLFRSLEELGADLAGDVVAHLVVVEENGGNGTLAMARLGERADGCVVLEPSDRRLYTSIRGAVWFRIECEGRAGHSGQAGSTRSALLMARDAMGILEAYHADLLRKSRGFPLFDPHPNPMPITFGRLQAGNWPASAPSRAVLEGVLGLLPNRTKEAVMEEMRAALRGGCDEFFARNTAVHFMYRHDSSVLDPSHDFPQTILRAAKAAGTELTVSGMTASCDAWFYNNQLGIPTVVTGPGSLKFAHSREERIGMDEIAAAAETMVAFAADFCGR